MEAALVTERSDVANVSVSVMSHVWICVVDS